MASVNIPMTFNALVEGTDVGFAKLGLEASGGAAKDLKAHCLAIAKAAAEHEFKRLTSIGRSKRQQDKVVEVEAVLSADLDNTLE